MRVESGIDFEFLQPDALPAPLLVLDDIVAGYGERRVLDNVTWTLRPGDRVGLLGANGAGKSTLVKLIAGVLPPRQGERRESKGLAIGYFAQHQLEQLDGEATPIQHLLRIEPALGEQAARDFLGGFGLAGERALSRVAPFSGGEKARLALALVVFLKPNLLLLDEPTNHLDIQSQQVLQKALSEYPGSYCIVSHNRSFLDPIVTKVLEFVPGEKPRVYLGNVSDYLEKVERN